MKKAIISAALLVIFSLNVFPQVTFQKTFGGINYDAATSLQPATDGGYYILGSTNSFGADSTDVYLLKTDINGNLVWSKTFGGPQGDIGRILLLSSDGNLMILGSTNSFGAGNWDVYLIKTDSSGNLIWNKTYGGVNNEAATSIQQTTDGGFIIVGQTSSFGAGVYDSYAIKTDADGDTLWTKTYGSAAQQWATSVQQTGDGGYIIAGGTSASKSRLSIMKTNSQGDLSWSRTYGDYGRNYNNAAVVLNNGEIFICYERSTSGPDDICLMKIDIAGNILWQKNLGLFNGPGSVKVNANGEFIISGTQGLHQHGDAGMIKCDSNGNGILSAFYTSPYPYLQSFSDAFQTSDGGFIMAGTSNYYGLGYNDIFLVKTDFNGNSGCNDTVSNALTYIDSTIFSFSPDTAVSQTNTVIGIPNTIVGTGCITTTVCYAVGIDESDEKAGDISLFPNPVDGELRIKNSEFKIDKVEIYDVLSRKVFSQQPAANSQQLIINVSSFPSGIYFLQVTNEKGNKTVRKFIKD